MKVEVSFYAIELNQAAPDEAPESLDDAWDVPVTQLVAGAQVPGVSAHYLKLQLTGNRDRPLLLKRVEVFGANRKMAEGPIGKPFTGVVRHPLPKPTEPMTPVRSMRPMEMRMGTMKWDGKPRKIKSAKKFRTKCGKPLNPTDPYCAGCGEKV